ADLCDAFDSYFDNEPTAQSICVANLSSAGPTNQQAGPSNASILYEVHDLENAIDSCDDNQDEHEIHNRVEHKNTIDSTRDHMCNINVTPYEHYLSVNDVFVVPNYASSVLNDAYVLHDNVAYGNSTAGNGGAQIRAGNVNPGQGKPIKYFNCNGLGHIARNCTQPKRQQNFDYFKDKMLLMQAQENDLCDAFDSYFDNEPTAQSICVANLSSAGPTNQQAGPSNASILYEVHDLENAIDSCDDNQDEHEIHNRVEHKNTIDSTRDHMCNINVTPYEHYLSVNDVFVVPNYASSVLNDAYVLHDNVAYVPHDI
nr:hypothetical protein [Tanacetum cinerariifolium]